MRLNKVVITDVNAPMSICTPKIINGSILSIGDKIGKTSLPVDQHFNWFQKLMWKWAFGIKVKDYSGSTI